MVCPLGKSSEFEALFVQFDLLQQRLSAFYLADGDFFYSGLRTLSLRNENCDTVHRHSSAARNGPVLRLTPIMRGCGG